MDNVVDINSGPEITGFDFERFGMETICSENVVLDCVDMMNSVNFNETTEVINRYEPRFKPIFSSYGDIDRKISTFSGKDLSKSQIDFDECYLLNSFTRSGFGNFSHLYFELAPHLPHITKDIPILILLANRPDVKICTKKNRQKFQDFIKKCMGIQNRVIYCEFKTYCIRKLYHISSKEKTRYIVFNQSVPNIENRYICDFVKDKLSKEENPYFVKYRKRFFLYEDRKGYRRVLDRSIVAEHIKICEKYAEKRGLKFILWDSSLNIYQQSLIVNNSEIIVAIRGSIIYQLYSANNCHIFLFNTYFGMKEVEIINRLVLESVILNNRTISVYQHHNEKLDKDIWKRFNTKYLHRFLEQIQN